MNPTADPRPLLDYQWTTSSSLNPPLSAEQWNTPPTHPPSKGVSSPSSAQAECLNTRPCTPQTESPPLPPAETPRRRRWDDDFKTKRARLNIERSLDDIMESGWRSDGGRSDNFRHAYGCDCLRCVDDARMEGLRMDGTSYVRSNDLRWSRKLRLGKSEESSKRVPYSESPKHVRKINDFDDRYSRKRFYDDSTSYNRRDFHYRPYHSNDDDLKSRKAEDEKFECLFDLKAFGGTNPALFGDVDLELPLPKPSDAPTIPLYYIRDQILYPDRQYACVALLNGFHSRVCFTVKDCHTVGSWIDLRPTCTSDDRPDVEFVWDMEQHDFRSLVLANDVPLESFEVELSGEYMPYDPFNEPKASSERKRRKKHFDDGGKAEAVALTNNDWEIRWKGLGDIRNRYILSNDVDGVCTAIARSRCTAVLRYIRMIQVAFDQLVRQLQRINITIDSPKSKKRKKEFVLGVAAFNTLAECVDFRQRLALSAMVLRGDFDLTDECARKVRLVQGLEDCGIKRSIQEVDRAIARAAVFQNIDHAFVKNDSVDGLLLCDSPQTFECHKPTTPPPSAQLFDPRPPADRRLLRTRHRYIEDRRRLAKRWYDR